MQGFAFYEEANVKVTGVFNGAQTSVFLEPKAGKPNCFTGPQNLIAEAGKDYELDVSITWDSAGKKTISNFNAKTYIPQKFKIQRAYDLEGQQYKYGDTVLYLPPPTDLQSNYYIPEYSNDVGGILVSLIFPDDVYWGENSIDALAEQFMQGGDTARHAEFGDRYTVFSAANQSIAGMKNVLDSIPVIGLNMPAVGSFKLLFYATTSEFIKFRQTFVNGDDSRIKAVYNIDGGAGIFAGMMVDTFEVNIKTLADVKIYQYDDAQKAYCYRMDEEYGMEYLKTRRRCVELWDKTIWQEFYGDDYEAETYPPWYEIPSDFLKRILNMSDLVTWCEHRDFPIDKYPLCGSVLVYYSKNSGNSSPILSREVEKWCKEHKNDEQC
jgi:hypothetical protein